MKGFQISGKAFCVAEDLKREAARYKGMTVWQVMRLREHEIAEAKQFGTTVSAIRRIK